MSLLTAATIPNTTVTPAGRSQSDGYVTYPTSSVLPLTLIRFELSVLINKRADSISGLWGFTYAVE